MPIHEFQCKSCNYVFELLLMSKKELEDVTCPKCQSPEVGKLMSAPNLSVSQGSSTTSSVPGNANKPSVHTNRCKSGTCTHINLPGMGK